MNYLEVKTLADTIEAVMRARGEYIPPLKDRNQWLLSNSTRTNAQFILMEIQRGNTYSLINYLDSELTHMDRDDDLRYVIGDLIQELQSLSK